MAKATVNMTNWEVYVYEGNYNLSGVADNHPELGKDTPIYYTSELQRFNLSEDVLTYETRNTIYVCPLKFMALRPYCSVVPEYKEELRHRDEGEASDLDRLIAATACIATGKIEENTFAQQITAMQEAGQEELKQMEEKELQRLSAILEAYEDSIYMEVSNIECGSKLAYHLGEHYGIVKPWLHSGMFQDSILYTLYPSEENDDCSLDFRYFPRGFGNVMETYGWSDNIKQAVIKNECTYPIHFNGCSIGPGETKVFQNGVGPEDDDSEDSEA